MYPINAQDYTLLLVDDKPENLLFLSAYLEKLGFNLFIARHGEEAFARIDYQRPDLILLDILMPDIDGFEVCRRLKANEETRDIPVIFTTALTEIVDKVRGFDVGAVDYITKPFELEEVLARIKTHLMIQKLHRQIRESEQKHCQEKMEQLRRTIITRIPHELRTPLTGILGLSEFMLQMYNTDDTLREFSTDIKNSAERLNQYVEKYLLYIETELLASHAEQNTHLRDACLNKPTTVVLEVAGFIAYRAKRQEDLALNLGDSQNITLAITPEHFQVILRSIVSNAFKFSQAGQRVSITSVARDTDFCFIVTDLGRGMTAEQINNIGAFAQFDRDIHEQQGAGIELLTAIRLCEVYGGHMQIHSAGIGQGCQVTLCFVPVPECSHEQKEDL
jgi:DNA-binding response OmpR family regulator